MSKVRRVVIGAAAAATVGMLGLAATGRLPALLALLPSRAGASVDTTKALPKTQAPAVTVVRVEPSEFVEQVLVTGSLVAREEVLVAPEVEGLRVLEILVDEGDKVHKGQVLARLVHETIDAQLAQNDAALVKSAAAIAQAKSNIVQAEAKLQEAQNAFERAKPLKQSGTMSGSVFDQRESAARTAEAQLVAARDGLKVAEAERAQAEAQRREIVWRRGKTEVHAPADGIVGHKNARLGALAGKAAETMFRIVADGEIELDAELPEQTLARMKVGQSARISVAGLEDRPGRVRLIGQEIDKVNRLGRVRIALGADPALRVGAFGRGFVETARSHGPGLPVSAVLFGSDGAFVQVVRDAKVASTKVELGINTGGRVEVRKGLAQGDIVVARAGTFLRDGDMVRPVAEASRVSEAR